MPAPGRILIFGTSEFVGLYLCRALREALSDADILGTRHTKHVPDWTHVSKKMRWEQIEGGPVRLRPFDIPFAAGIPSQLKGDCGWEPEIPWDHTVPDYFNRWCRVARQSD